MLARIRMVIQVEGRGNDVKGPVKFGPAMVGLLAHQKLSDIHLSDESLSQSAKESQAKSRILV